MKAHTATTLMGGAKGGPSAELSFVLDKMTPTFNVCPFVGKTMDVAFLCYLNLIFLIVSEVKHLFVALMTIFISSFVTL